MCRVRHAIPLCLLSLCMYVCVVGWFVYQYIVYSVEQICLRYLLEVEFQHKHYGGW